MRSSTQETRVVRSPRDVQHGFTVLELMLTVMIITILASMITTSYGTYRARVQNAQAVTDITALEAAIGSYAMDNHALPASLDDLGPGYAAMRDPWGSLYQYANHGADSDTGKFRKDKNIVPINSDFDLYSVGPDRDSRPPLTAPASRDDIVRANNGRFVGPASSYDP